MPQDRPLRRALARSALTRSALARLAVPVALAAGATVALPAPAGAAADEMSIVTMFGDEYAVGGNVARMWRTGAGAIDMSGSAADGVTLRLHDGNDGGGWSDLKFAAPEGEALTAGTTYADASDFSDTGAIIDATVDHHGCGHTVGRFTVLDITPNLSRVHIVYEAACEIGPGGNFGEVRINVPDDGTGVVVAPTQVAWPASYPKKASGLVPVTVLNTGSTPVKVSSATITGDPDFTVKGSTCTTIAAGGSCAVSVSFTPTGTGPRAGTLTIVDDTTTGTRTVPLTGSGFAGVTSFRGYGQVGARFGHANYAFTPLNSRLSASGDLTGVSLTLKTTQAESNYWTFGFGAAEGSELTAGMTYTASEGEAGTGTMDFWHDGSACDDQGWFTVHEIGHSFGRLTRLSVTFDNKCWAGAGSFLGSLAWRADAAQPVPGIALSNPDPVQNLKVAGSLDSVKLSWSKPLTPDYAGVMVRGAVGTKPPTSPEAGFLVYEGTALKAEKTELRYDGTTYSFSAFTKDKEDRYSKRSSVYLDGSKLTVAASRSSVPYFQDFELTGKLTDARTGAAITGRKVEVWAIRPLGKTWYTVGSTTTDAYGRYRLNVGPGVTYDYWVVYKGSGNTLGTEAGGVRVKVGMGVDVAQDRYSGRSGTTFTIGTVVGPVSAGKTVVLQRLVGGKWVDVQKGTLYKSKATFFKVRPTAKGTYSYRVFKARQGEYAAGYSRTLTIKVT